MLPVLKVPGKTPRFATDSGATLEPAESYKNTGATIGTATPARNANWLWNLDFEWSRRVLGPVVANWYEGTAISSQNVASALFNPNVGIFVALDSAASNNVHRSVGGNIWVAGTDTSNSPKRDVATIDSTRYIIGTQNQDLETSGNGGGSTWAVITSATIGGSGALDYIETKHRPGTTDPDSSHAILLRGTPMQVRLAVTSVGVSGTWTTPSTAPPSVPTNAFGAAVISCGGDTWVIMSRGPAETDTKLWRSTNNGDVWAAVSVPSFASGATGGKHLAWSDNTGRLVLTGSATNPDTNYFAYSDDMGDTWTAATLDRKGFSPSGAQVTNKVYYCGGDCWVATEDSLNVGALDNRTIYYSLDNAVTWEVADINRGTTLTTPIDTIVCDERKVMAMGSTGFNLKTLNI
jgi:hypothetical protein